MTKTKKAQPNALGSKLGTLANLLKRPEGATIAQLVEATGWQAHSVRGAMSGALKKKHAILVTSEKVDGTRFYRSSRADKE